PLDVDAPVGAGARAQHADRAVLLLERDDAARAGGRILSLVRVLHGDRRLQHRLERDAEAADHAGKLGLLHIAALKTPVRGLVSRPVGSTTCEASSCSWSARRRGKGKRPQNMRNPPAMILANSTSGPRKRITPIEMPHDAGSAQPPR